MSAATETEARARVQRALQHIQRAQEELGRAQSELSSIAGAATLGSLIGKLYDRVHASWYRVRDGAAKRKLDLDSLSGPLFEARLAAATVSAPTASPQESTYRG